MASENSATEVIYANPVTALSVSMFTGIPVDLISMDDWLTCYGGLYQTIIITPFSC